MLVAVAMTGAALSAPTAANAAAPDEPLNIGVIDATNVFVDGSAIVGSLAADEDTTSRAADAVPTLEPAGKYYYVCVATNGSSNTLAVGVEMRTCKGSYLKQYLNGAQTKSISLTSAGAVSSPSSISIDCAIGIVSTTIAVFTTSGTLAWIGAIAGGIGSYRACKA